MYSYNYICFFYTNLYLYSFTHNYVCTYTIAYLQLYECFKFNLSIRQAVGDKFKVKNEYLFECY